MGLMNAIGLQPRHPAPSVTSQGTQTPVVELQNAETQTERELSEPSSSSSSSVPPPQLPPETGTKLVPVAYVWPLTLLLMSTSDLLTSTADYADAPSTSQAAAGQTEPLQSEGSGSNQAEAETEAAGSTTGTHIIIASGWEGPL